MHARLMGVLGAVAAAGAVGLATSAAAGAAAARGQLADRAGEMTPNAGSGFAVAAVSFWAPARGVALGGVGCTFGQACAARLMITADGGERWRFLRAAAADVIGGRPAVSVSRVLFVTARLGWLYGPALWSTRDGGARWHKLSLGGTVKAMAASGGRVYAVVSRSGQAPELFASPVSRDSWKRVGHVSGHVLAVYGRSAWLGSNRYLWATANGVRWHKYAFRCQPGARSPGLASITAASPARILLLCLGPPAGPQQAKALMGSANGGRTSRLIRSLTLPGDGGVIAVPPLRPRVITLGTEYYLDTSTDGGKTWTTKLIQAGGGAPWTSVFYPSPATGWAEVGGPPTFDALLRTTNAGRTWHRVRF